jgi:2',3'-cyclic-nucleotide 2'-phosphodiesterase (5'-nucleotidase family)
MTLKPSLALLLVLALAACGRYSGRETDTVVLLATGDLHSALSPDRDAIGGLARIAGYASRLRRERPDVLLLDAGDAVAGTPISSLTQGRAAFTVMTTAGYDAMAIGNHEFDYGLDVLADYRLLAGFPLLAANIDGDDGEPVADAPFVILDVDGVRVAVTGVTWEGTPAKNPARATAGAHFRPASDALRTLLPELRSQADLVVVLSHQGIEADRALAGSVPGIDVILGGHSHSETPQPERFGDTLLLHTGRDGRNLGRLDLTVRLGGGGVVEAEGRLLRVDESFPVDRDVASIVTAFEDRVRTLTSVLLTHAERAISEARVKALAEEAYAATLGTDLGFQNQTGVRGGLPAGDVRVGDVWAALPFDNTLCVLAIRGRSLPAWARERLGSVEPERLYTIATTSFIAEQAERHFPGGVVSSSDSGRSAREAVIEHLKGATVR